MKVYDSQLKRNPKAYIDYLQSQNRVKKQSELQDKEKIINKQKEDAFNIYLQGANLERVDNQRKRERKSKLREKSLGVNVRKQWGSDAPRPVTKPRLPPTHPDAFLPSNMPTRSESLRTVNKHPVGPVAKSEKEQVIEYLNTFSEEKLSKVLYFLNNLLSSEYLMKIEIQSTWGCTHSVGITELEILDLDCNSIPITSEDIVLENCASSSVSRMIDGVKYTNNSKHMWLAPLPPPPLPLTISIKLLQPPLGLRIWNYNKSILDSTKGLKAFKISINHLQIWEGEVPKASGDTTTEYCSQILFCDTN